MRWSLIVAIVGFVLGVIGIFVAIWANTTLGVILAVLGFLVGIVALFLWFRGRSRDATKEGAKKTVGILRTVKEDRKVRGQIARQKTKEGFVKAGSITKRTGKALTPAFNTKNTALTGAVGAGGLPLAIAAINPPLLLSPLTGAPAVVGGVGGAGVGYWNTRRKRKNRERKEAEQADQMRQMQIQQIQQRILQNSMEDV